MSRFLFAVLLAILMVNSSRSNGQEPPKPPTTEKVEPVPAPPVANLGRDFQRNDLPNSPEVVKPLPPVAIPDDPPPHEGAMIDLPVTVDAPDILDIYVLEALPGRPITGSRLIKPDGRVNLGFYGDLYVRGLTTEQVKVKLVLHLREYLNDEALGLIQIDGPPAEPNQGKANDELAPPIPPNGKRPFDPNNEGGPFLKRMPVLPPDVVPSEILRQPEVTPKPVEAPKPPQSVLNRRKRLSDRSSDHVAAFRERRRIQKTSLISENVIPTRKEPGPFAELNPNGLKQVPDVFPPGIRRINPADTLSVFVDISSFNTKVYYVQGDVGVPGRLPWTGNETVLDALNYAGGLVPIAEPEDIHLYRPARGGKPAKDYKIDYSAILKGVATANLQMFPGDRLVVGRNPIVKKTVEIDRALSPINSVLNSLFQESLTLRYAGAINSPMSTTNNGIQTKVNGQNIPLGGVDSAVMTPAQRDAFVKAYFEFVLSLTSKEGGALLDEAKFREALMKKLSTPTPTPPEAK